jgi:S-formylglutathione hydrolase FrmB
MIALMAWFQINFFSQCQHRQVPLNVLLPAEYAPPGARFKTLYLLHGYMGDCSDWLLNTPVNELAQQFGMAVVMPNGENGFYVDQPTSGVLGGQYIGEELVDYTRRLFPLSHAREDTLIGGLSMGGYGALRAALKYPETFGHCIALSSALATEVIQGATDEPNLLGVTKSYYERLFGDLTKMNESDNAPLKLARDVLAAGGPVPDLFLACGYNDRLSNPNRELHKGLEALSFPHVYEEGPGTHEWAFWRLFLRRGLEHALGKPAGGFPNPFFCDNYDPQYDVIGERRN